MDTGKIHAMNRENRSRADSRLNRRDRSCPAEPLGSGLLRDFPPCKAPRPVLRATGWAVCPSIERIAMMRGHASHAGTVHRTKIRFDLHHDHRPRRLPEEARHKWLVNPAARKLQAVRNGPQQSCDGRLCHIESANPHTFAGLASFVLFKNPAVSFGEAPVQFGIRFPSENFSNERIVGVSTGNTLQRVEIVFTRVISTPAMFSILVSKFIEWRRVRWNRD